MGAGLLEMGRRDEGIARGQGLAFTHDDSLG